MRSTATNHDVSMVVTHLSKEIPKRNLYQVNDALNIREKSCTTIILPFLHDQDDDDWIVAATDDNDGSSNFQ